MYTQEHTYTHGYEANKTSSPTLIKTRNDSSNKKKLSINFLLSFYAWMCTKHRKMETSTRQFLYVWVSWSTCKIACSSSNRMEPHFFLPLFLSFTLFILLLFFFVYSQSRWWNLKHWYAICMIIKLGHLYSVPVQFLLHAFAYMYITFPGRDTRKIKRHHFYFSRKTSWYFILQHCVIGACYWYMLFMLCLYTYHQNIVRKSLILS